LKARIESWLNGSDVAWPDTGLTGVGQFDLSGFPEINRFRLVDAGTNAATGVALPRAVRIADHRADQPGGVNYPGTVYQIGYDGDADSFAKLRVRKNGFMLVSERQPDPLQPSHIVLVPKSGNVYVSTGTNETASVLTAPQASTQVVTAGNVVTLTNKTIQSPTFTGTFVFQTAAGKRVFSLPTSPTAVNGIEISPSGAGLSPQIVPAGDDTDIGIVLSTKGNGRVQTLKGPVGVKVAVPASATDPGRLGEWAADNDFIYVCTAADTWRRAALQTW
jgi:hypothetical protein